MPEALACPAFDVGIELEVAAIIVIGGRDGRKGIPGVVQGQTFLVLEHETRFEWGAFVVFSQCEEIFQSPMATAAAIDRIVHHSVITEFDVPSFRTAVAQKAAKKPAAQGRRAVKKSSRK